ncbi:hypothetical protein PFISCL1PPCAC_12096, partial [Pristionchus fissidentatus]
PPLPFSPSSAKYSLVANPRLPSAAVNSGLAAETLSGSTLVRGDYPTERRTLHSRGRLPSCDPEWSWL